MGGWDDDFVDMCCVEDTRIAEGLHVNFGVHVTWAVEVFSSWIYLLKAGMSIVSGVL